MAKTAETDRAARNARMDRARDLRHSLGEFVQESVREFKTKVEDTPAGVGGWARFASVTDAADEFGKFVVDRARRAFRAGLDRPGEGETDEGA